MPGLRRRRGAEPREHQQHRGREHDGADEERASRPCLRERVRPEDRKRQDDGNGKPVAGGEVAERALEVAEHVERRAEPAATTAHADLEAAGEDEIVRQNGMPSTRTIARDAAASRSLVLVIAT